MLATQTNTPLSFSPFVFSYAFPSFPPQAPEADIKGEAASPDNCGPYSSPSQLSTSFKITIFSFISTSRPITPNAVALGPPPVAHNILAQTLAGAEIDPSSKAITNH